MKHLAARAGCLLAVLVTAMCTTACSSDESRVYDAFKCGKAATVLGHRAQAGAAARYAEKYPDPASGSKARYAAMLGQKFRDEYDLERMGPEDYLSSMSKLYTSSRCTAIFE